ncbi:hypothetical protein ACRAKI_12285 [Saccharothrix isguenensis]
MTDESTAHRRATGRTSLRHLGDSPYSAVLGWALLIALLGVDVPLLQTMLAENTRSDEWQSWVIAAGFAVVLTATAWLATEFTLRAVEHRGRRHWVAAVGFWLLWLGGVAGSFVFRYLHPTEQFTPDTTTSSGIALGGGTPPVEPPVDVSMALLLTALVVLTGAVASGVGVFGHDDLQRQRRQSARRVQRLRWWVRSASTRFDRHTAAMEVQQAELDAVPMRLQYAVDQLVGIAASLKQRVRHLMAEAQGDPRATTALVRHHDAGPADPQPPGPTTWRAP